MKIIPAIDLIEGKTVRLEQGKYDRQLSYDVDPVEAARKWEAQGAKLIHIVDLDGARKGEPSNVETVRKITRAVTIPVEVGGGFRKVLQVKGALDHGVSRVIVGSKAFEEMDFARSCLETFGERVIFSVDAKNLEVRIHGWEDGIDLDIFEVLKKFVSFGSKEIIYTDVQKDGMLSGPSIDQLTQILEKVDINIISAGGVKTVEHIKELKKLESLGLSGVIIGRALYDGTIDLKEAIDAG
ncbi:MAG: 1-(5-phosphoribosyl)-5-[(5-phosphoribosylamino)methylideneamino]imidazole-4-carboxamide isomerase [Candidatus Tantalella remota]|nr:1-(5-phosphoribosyl)-5-[(5-phosphoribosylamino)methylideneamino]imidazole-4-carboxamide isomerase [Candidatus Tantalella remota]